MKTGNLLRRALACLLCLMLCIGCASTAFAAETASTIRLSKTQGTVTVSSSAKGAITVRNNLRLLSGYHVKTAKSSYAWLSLDSTKAVKLDAASEIEIRQSDKKLEVLVVSGNLSFNVDQLKSDETLNIRSSSTVMGIRGTTGFFSVLDKEHTHISLLHGTVECTVENPVSGSPKTTRLTAGESAVFTVYPEPDAYEPTGIEKSELTVDDIPGFVMTEIAANPELKQEIEDATGLDLSDVTADTAAATLAEDEDQTNAAIDQSEAEKSAQEQTVSQEDVWEDTATEPEPSSEPSSSGPFTISYAISGQIASPREDPVNPTEAAAGETVSVGFFIEQKYRLTITDSSNNTIPASISFPDSGSDMQVAEFTMPSGNVTVSYKQLYRVIDDISLQEHEFSADKEWYDAGETADINVVIPDAYMLSLSTESGGQPVEITGTHDETYCTFTMPSDNVLVSAVQKPTYAISVGSDFPASDNVVIQDPSDALAYEGQLVTLTLVDMTETRSITAVWGNDSTEFTIPVDTDLSGGTASTFYTFTMPAGAVTLTDFAHDGTYSIEYSGDCFSMLDGTPPTSATEGETVTLSLKSGYLDERPYYRFFVMNEDESTYVDVACDYDNPTNYSFTMPASDVMVESIVPLYYISLNYDSTKATAAFAGSMTVDPDGVGWQVDGQTVAIEVTPAANVTIAEFRAVDAVTKEDADVMVDPSTNNGVTTYLFDMISWDIEFQLEFTASSGGDAGEGDAPLLISPAPTAGSFSDVASDQWYAPYVAACSTNGWMDGVGNGLFAPDTTVTRAMAVTVLWRLCGRPELTGEDAFSDIAADWYRDSALWAARSGLSNGYGDGVFGPDNEITRQQLAVFFWRLSGCPDASAEAAYADMSIVADYARSAVNWATEVGLMNGVTADIFGPIFAPNASATRAQLAAVLLRYNENAASLPAVQRMLDPSVAPAGILRAPDGMILIADAFNKKIWSLRDGEAKVLAGSDSTEDPYGAPMGGYNDAAAASALFAGPRAIAPFLGGWAVSDTENNAIRLIDENGVRTLNFNMSDRLSAPSGLAADSDGKLYVADTQNSRILCVSDDGSAYVFAYGLSEPTGICWKDGVLYVAETGANRILRFDSSYSYTVVAGSGEQGFLDGEALSATFSSPQAVAVDDNGVVYVADTVNGAIRRIANGSVDTLLATSGKSDELFPVSPTGLMLWGRSLFVCDSFAHKLFALR